MYVILCRAEKEETVSRINGEKARAAVARKRTVKRRASDRALREAHLASRKSGAAPAAPAKQAKPAAAADKPKKAAAADPMAALEDLSKTTKRPKKKADTEAS